MKNAPGPYITEPSLLLFRRRLAALMRVTGIGQDELAATIGQSPLDRPLVDGCQAAFGSLTQGPLEDVRRTCRLAVGHGRGRDSLGAHETRGDRLGAEDRGHGRR